MPALVCTASMKRKTLRRIAGAALIVAGAFLMWLSADLLLGGLLMAAGIGLEIAGITLEHT